MSETLKKLFKVDGSIQGPPAGAPPGSNIDLGPGAVTCRYCGARIRSDVEACRYCGKWRHKTALIIAGLIAIFISALAAFAVFTGTV